MILMNGITKNSKKMHPNERKLLNENHDFSYPITEYAKQKNMEEKFEINDVVVYGDIKNAIVGAIIDGGKQYRIHYCITGNESQCYTVDVAPEEISKLE
jgi:hypothetical protein